MQTYKLGEIAKVFAGSSAPQEGKYFVNGKYPFLRTGDLGAAGTTNNLMKIGDYINDLCIKECTVTFAKKGTLVFPKSGQSVNTNKKGVLGLDSYVVSHLCCIDSGNEITNRFIYYFFCTKNLSDWSDNDAYPSLKLEVIKQIQIPLPPLATQRAIADKLDKLQSLIDLKKQAITKTDELAKSIFLEMFGDPMKNEKGWKVKELSKFGKIITGNTPSRQKKEYYGDYIDWIKSDNINTNNTYITEATEKLSVEGMKVGRTIPKHSILVTCIAGSLSCIGNVAITNKEVSFNQQINGIIPNDSVNYLFLYNLIVNSKKYIQNKSSHGMKGIVTKGVFEKLEFPLPPLPLQQKFADIITQIEAQKSEHKLALAKLEELYQATMQESFTI